MKKYLLLFLIILLITGCYSKEDKKLVKQYKEQGKINAINYVKEKYGFDAKIKSIKAEKKCDEKDGCFLSRPSGNVIVKMNYNKKTFNVYVTGINESNEATDDYQLDDIKNDIIELLKTSINLELYDYKLNLNSNGIKELYDNNLNDMSKYIDSIDLYYIGENNLDSINTTNITNFLQSSDGTINIINFKDKEKCDGYKNTKFDKKEFLLVYKESELILNKNSRNFYKYDKFTTYNDEVYVYSPTTNNRFDIAESKLDDIKNYKKLYEDLNYKKITQISKAFEINRPREILYVYFNKKDIKTNYKDKFFIASECNVKGVKKHFINSYFNDHTDIRINDIGLYLTEEENFSICDANSKVIFALIKVSY